jgi:hypothetical protein
MLKRNAKAKAEFFGDAGEIQIVPIDTVIGADDGGFDLGADGSRRNQSQGFGARGKSRRHPRCLRDFAC